MWRKLDNAAHSNTQVMLRDVEDLIEGEKWTLDQGAAKRWKQSPWAGAGIIICESLPPQEKESCTYVASPYVVELSWVIDKLKIICSDFVDFTNKHAFYGRLADAANTYLTSRSPDQQNPKNLCRVVLQEAMRCVEEANGR